jgi:hypothetical protein
MQRANSGMRSGIMQSSPQRARLVLPSPLHDWHGGPPMMPLNLPRRRMERADVAAPQKVGAAHDAKALFLERLVEKADAGE